MADVDTTGDSDITIYDGVSFTPDISDRISCWRCPQLSVAVTSQDRSYALVTDVHPDRSVAEIPVVLPECPAAFVPNRHAASRDQPLHNRRITAMKLHQRVFIISRNAPLTDSPATGFHRSYRWIKRRLCGRDRSDAGSVLPSHRRQIHRQFLRPYVQHPSLSPSGKCGAM